MKTSNNLQQSQSLNLKAFEFSLPSVFQFPKQRRHLWWTWAFEVHIGQTRDLHTSKVKGGVFNFNKLITLSHIKKMIRGCFVTSVNVSNQTLKICAYPSSLLFEKATLSKTQFRSSGAQIKCGLIEMICRAMTPQEQPVQPWLAPSNDGGLIRWKAFSERIVGISAFPRFWGAAVDYYNSPARDWL